MKIAYIFLGRKAGGSAYSYELVKNLDKEIDIYPIISTYLENGDLWFQLSHKPYTVKTYRNFKEMILSFFNVKEFYKLYRYIKSINPTVIHYPIFHPWIPLLNMIFFKKKKVYTCHDPIIHEGEKYYYFMRFLQSIILMQVKNIIILNNKYVEYFRKKYKHIEINVIPHGNFNYYAMRDSNKNQFRNVILFFGRIVEYKGLDNLLDVFNNISNQLPEKVELWIVGEGDLNKYRNKLINSRIKVVNRYIPDEEVQSFFEKAYVTVLPYKTATQSGVIPLSYSFGVPVIVTNVGAITEQVENGKTGFIVKNNEELSNKLIEIFSIGQDKYNSMVKECKIYSSEKLSWGEIARLTVRVYERC